jgi:hypothetical protein
MKQAAISSIPLRLTYRDPEEDVRTSNGDQEGIGDLARMALYPDDGSIKILVHAFIDLADGTVDSIDIKYEGIRFELNICRGDKDWSYMSIDDDVIRLEITPFFLDSTIGYLTGYIRRGTAVPNCISFQFIYPQADGSEQAPYFAIHVERAGKMQKLSFEEYLRRIEKTQGV